MLEVRTIGFSLCSVGYLWAKYLIGFIFEPKCVNHKSFEVGPSWAVLCSMRSITWAWVSTHLVISLCRCFKMEYPTQSGFEHLTLGWLWVLVPRDIPLFWKREDLSKWASTTHTHTSAGAPSPPGFLILFYLRIVTVHFVVF